MAGGQDGEGQLQLQKEEKGVSEARQGCAKGKVRVDLPGVRQSEDFEFVIESFQGRSKVAGRRGLKGKIRNGFGWSEKQDLP